VTALAKPRHASRRLTEGRVADLRAEIAELRGETQARFERLEWIVAGIAELPAAMARAQAGALLGVLRDLKPSRPPAAADDDRAGP
jgi:hypothetical protein